MSNFQKFRATLHTYNIKDGIEGRAQDPIYQDADNFELPVQNVMTSQDVEQTLSSITPLSETVIRVSNKDRLIRYIVAEFTLANDLYANHPFDYIAHSAFEVVRYKMPGCERMDMRPEFTLAWLLQTCDNEDKREQYHSVAGRSGVYYPAGTRFYALVPLPFWNLSANPSQKAKPLAMHLTTEPIDITFRVAQLQYRFVTYSPFTATTGDNNKFDPTTAGAGTLQTLTVAWSQIKLIFHYSDLSKEEEYKIGVYRYKFKALYGLPFDSPSLVTPYATALSGVNLVRSIDLFGLRSGETSQLIFQFRPYMIGALNSSRQASSSLQIFLGRTNSDLNSQFPTLRTDTQQHLVDDLSGTNAISNNFYTAIRQYMNQPKSYWLQIVDPFGELVRRDITQNQFYGQRLRNFKILLGGQQIWTAFDDQYKIGELLHNRNETLFWGGRRKERLVQEYEFEVPPNAGISNSFNWLQGTTNTGISGYPSTALGVKTTFAGGLLQPTQGLGQTGTYNTGFQWPDKTNRSEVFTNSLNAGDNVTSVLGVGSSPSSEDWVCIKGEYAVLGGTGVPTTTVAEAFSAAYIDIQNSMTGEILTGVRVWRYQKTIGDTTKIKPEIDHPAIVVGNGFSLPPIQKRKSRFYTINMAELQDFVTVNAYSLGVDFTNSHVKLLFEVSPETDDLAITSNTPVADHPILGRPLNFESVPHDTMYPICNYDSRVEAVNPGTMLMTQSLTSIYQFEGSTCVLMQ